MTPWAETQRHHASEITLLCPNHHADKTRGLLPEADVRQANANPRNTRVGESAPYAIHGFRGTTCTVSASPYVDFYANIARTGERLILFSIDGVVPIEFRLGADALLMTLRVADKEGNTILQIIENELVFSVAPWDIEIVGARFTVREAKRDFFLDMRLLPPNRVEIMRWSYSSKFGRVDIGPEGLRLFSVDNPRITIRGPGKLVIDAALGACIGENSTGLGAGIGVP